MSRAKGGSWVCGCEQTSRGDVMAMVDIGSIQDRPNLRLAGSDFGTERIPLAQ